MRKAPFFLISLLIIIVLTVWIGTAQSISVSADSAAFPSTLVPVNRQVGSPQQPVGIPAIRPNTNTASTDSSAASLDASTPTFTTADVRAYIRTHSMPHTIAASSNPAVLQILFITSQAASGLLDGESTGLPDNTLVCYVELSGSYTFAGPNGANVTFQKGYELFDAHTGNLLMVGGLS